MITGNINVYYIKTQYYVENFWTDLTLCQEFQFNLFYWYNTK